MKQFLLRPHQCGGGTRNPFKTQLMMQISYSLVLEAWFTHTR